MHSCQEKELTCPISVLQKQIPEAQQSVNDKLKLTKHQTHSLTHISGLCPELYSTVSTGSSVPASH